MHRILFTKNSPNKLKFIHYCESYNLEIINDYSRKNNHNSVPQRN